MAVLTKVVKSVLLPVYAFRGRNGMDKTMTDGQCIHLFGNLFDPNLLPPETSEEVDAELRAAGLDLERIKREAAVLVERLSREAHERLEK